MEPITPDLKHSPGNWYTWGWDDPEGTPMRILTHEGPSTGRTIATVLPQQEEATQHANARLIAAAPQLLTALITARHALYSYRHGNTSPDLADEIIQAATEAILTAVPEEEE